jgi:hypothetical protein
MPETAPLDRIEALREFLNTAEDREKARAWIIECLDPETDSELLEYLANEINNQQTN